MIREIAKLTHMSFRARDAKEGLDPNKENLDSYLNSKIM
jgi:hypothetical protein